MSYAAIDAGRSWRWPERRGCAVSAPVGGLGGGVGGEAASPTDRPSTMQTALTPLGIRGAATQVTSRAKAVAISAPRGKPAPASVRRTRTQRSGVGPEATHSVCPSITCSTVPENASPCAGGAAVQAAAAGSSRAGCGAGGQVSGCAAVAAIIAITANCTETRSLSTGRVTPRRIADLARWERTNASAAPTGVKFSVIAVRVRGSAAAVSILPLCARRTVCRPGCWTAAGPTRSGSRRARAGRWRRRARR